MGDADLGEGVDDPGVRAETALLREVVAFEEGEERLDGECGVGEIQACAQGADLLADDLVRVRSR